MSAPRRPATSASKRSPALRRLPLGSLRVFVAVAEQLNFGRAADALGVSTAAVSMQLRALEEYLKVPLLRRSGGRVELTEQGSRFLPRVRHALLELETAIDALRADRSKGYVALSTLPSFLQQWLLPRLRDFHERHPGIDLRIDTSRELVDFVRADIQAAVRFGLGDWPTLHVEKLLDEWLVPVCAPRMLAELGPVEDQRDLARYQLIHVLSEPWTSWPSGRALNRWAEQGLALDDSVSAVSAALAGHGLLLARWSLVAAEVQSGRLAVASRNIVPFERSYYFVCPQPYLALEKVAALRGWLLDQARAFPRPVVR